MATITSTPTATSLTISGNSSVSGTISWSVPNIPEGSTVVSCVLTGTSNVNMSKGSCSVTVNGSTVESGASFTIDLGTSNTTTSVTTTGKGNNKNAGGSVTFTNLLYTVTYQEPSVSVGIFNLKSGQSTITDVRVGETKIIRVYVGDTIIFENV